MLNRIRIYLLTRKANGYRAKSDKYGRAGRMNLDKADDSIRSAHRIETIIRTLRAAL